MSIAMEIEYIAFLSSRGMPQEEFMSLQPHDRVEMARLYAESKPRQPAGGAVAAPTRYIPPRSTFEMICNITVICGDNRKVIPVILDSGCHEQLTLEQSDIDILGLVCQSTRPVLYPDGCTGECQEFGPVSVEISLFDNSVARSDSITPSFLVPAASEAQGSCTLTGRILGYPAWRTLSIEVDFRNKRLVKKLRRI